MERSPAVYLMTSGFHGTLYTGVTSNLLQRVAQHREETFGGFTRRYEVKRLVWFEMWGSMEAAITREKQVKKWRREWKVALVERDNPLWRDLAEELGFEPLIVRRKVDPGSSPG
jgi:putative endonuclease